MPNENVPCILATVSVAPVASQHYWKCTIDLEKDGAQWFLRITDVFATNRYQDDDASCRKQLPDSFPAMTAGQLADFINAIAPCGPAWNSASRCVKPEETEALLQSARSHSDR